MSQTKCLFAYTPPGGTFPAYANLSDVDGALRLTVRAPAEYPGGSFHAHVGPQATIELPAEQLQAFAVGCLGWLAEHKLLKDDPPLARPLPATLAAGCCSSISPCGHQRSSPDTICAQCTLAHAQA